MTFLTLVPSKLVAAFYVLLNVVTFIIFWNNHLSSSRFIIGNEILLLLWKMMHFFQILALGGTFILTLPLEKGWKTELYFQIATCLLCFWNL
jgi:hypothetical protein